jgi:leucyl aminopeptidase
LTGAAMVALGQRSSALFATDRATEDRLREVGEETGDLVWPLPLWEEFEDDIKGTFGDVANSAKSRYGGAITAAVFLWQFIKDQPWVHLDIAPRMTAVDDEHLSKGAAGAGVALLTRFLEKF